MIEFVLVVPILAIIVSLTFFFGWALMHKHQVVVADRYAAWRRVETGSWPSENRLNAVCFANKAVGVSLTGSGVERETARDLVDEAGALSRRSEALAEELIVNVWPGGRSARVAAKFHGSQAFWERIGLGGWMQSRHGREGITWRCVEVNCWPGIDAPADGMASMIRTLYLEHWPDRTGQDGP